MSLFINDSCIGCTFCQNECPVQAISYDGDKYRIDPEHCIGCGTCSEVCLMDAVEDTEHPRSVPASHGPEKRSCDLCVVGGGAAGLIAAARYAEATGGKVIVLEKNRKPGGGGYFAVGLTPSNTAWEKDAGLPDTVEENVRRAMERTGGCLDEDLVRNLFRSLGGVFDWLCSWAPVEECFQLAPNPWGQLGVTTKSERYGSGRFITTHILPYLEKLGTEILTETEATALLRDPSGAVTGVLARDPGGEIEIRCAETLLCTGSLIRSERIRQLVPEFAGAKVKRYAHDMPGLTGDALTMAEQAGVSLDTDSIVMAFVGCMPVAFQQTAFQTGERADAIRVNLNGERWINEKADGKAMAEQLLHQPRAVSYTVLDRSILESSEPTLPPPPGAPAGPPGGFPYPGGVPDFAVQRGEKMPATAQAFRALAGELDHRTVLFGDTLEELAGEMGVDPAALAGTVARYNALCESGEDADFGKPAVFLRPLTDGPFIAIRNYLYLDGVFGGLDVNADMQVVSQGVPVPGLYAAGDITCGRYINDRLHKTEIVNDYSWAVAGGFMAANHMIEKSMQKESESDTRSERKI